MKLSIKALLLSGLVCPGVGQISLKHHVRGWFFIAIVVLCTYFLVTEAMSIAEGILAQTVRPGVIPDLNTIVASANTAATSLDTATMQYALAAIVITWIVSMVDAYFLGRNAERQDGDFE